MTANDSATAQLALGQLLDLAELNALVQIDLGPPLLRTRFRAAAAATAALGATGVAAAAIHGTRNGAIPRISIASRHAEASLLSFAFQRFHDPAHAPAQPLAPENRTAAAGFYAAKDGRIVYLHAGFPHNTQGLLSLLSVDDNRDQVAAAIAARPARDLEAAIAEAGLCGAMVRTAAEWNESVQGRLLARSPVVEGIQVGEGPRRPLSRTSERPLDGVRVLDLTRVLAGPTCARTLAMYGADALRIGAPQLPSIPLFVADTSLGKRSAFVDLTTETGRAVLSRLIGEADVFSQGYRSGALERLGFGMAEEVRAKHSNNNT